MEEAEEERIQDPPTAPRPLPGDQLVAASIGNEPTSRRPQAWFDCANRSLRRFREHPEVERERYQARLSGRIHQALLRRHCSNPACVYASCRVCAV